AAGRAAAAPRTPPPGGHTPAHKRAAAKPAAKPEAPPKPAEKLKEYSFSFDNQPWSKVIEWFADTTGLAFAGVFKPTGTFSFTPPKVNGGVKKYTIPEIVDIINEALQAQSSTQKYMLMRRSQTFTFVPADEKIDPGDVATVDDEDLARYGRTEVVKVSVGLRGADAEDVSQILQRTMSQWGSAIAIPPVNQLVLVDKVSSMQELLKTIKLMEEGEG